jgi:alpha-galactosidase
MRRTDVSYDGVRKRIAEWRDTADLLFGDYWPLTPYSLGDDVWLGWQFDRADLGRGMVQAFRRAGSIYETARMPLRGLDPKARYSVTDVDSGKSVEATGRDLMENGLAVTVHARPGAALVTYRRL